MLLHPAVSWILAIICAALHWLLAVTASKHNACTFDEVAHISGGLGQVVHGDYRLNPENGVLPQVVAGLSMATGGVRFPDVTDLSKLEAHSWRHSDSWEIGYQTLYANDNEATTVLLLGRAAVALSGAGTVLAVHGLARYVHDGEIVGSLLPTLSPFSMATLCPTMLAHGALITSDGMFTLFATLAPASVFWMLNAAAEENQLAKWRRCVAISVFAGCCVGGVMTAKHSGVVIAPIAIALLLLRMWKVPLRLMPSFLLYVIPCILVSVGAMMVVIWGMYGMRYGAFKHEECIQWKSNWDAGLGSQHGKLQGLPADIVSFARAHQLLPEAMLYGMSYAFLSTHARACFLAGKHGTEGWRYFFPYAVAVKTPSGVFALLAVALVALFTLAGARDKDSKAAESAPGSPRKLKSCIHRERPGPLYRMAPLIAFFVLYWIVAVNQNLNIGHRHMLPVYPPMYVFCGFCGSFFSWPPGGKDGVAAFRIGLSLMMQAITAVSIMWLASEVLGAYPYFLPFFNALVGGPARGYTHLVDSSLDWGQALPALKEFVDTEVAAVRQAGSTDPLYFYMSYFGLGNPPYHNLTSTADYTLMHLHSSVSGVSRPKHLQEVNVVLQPGYFCIAGSMLQPVYNAHAPGNWNAHYEFMYRRQARLMKRLLTVPDPLLHYIVTGQIPELHDMPKMLGWMDGFRLGRLCAFFRENAPYAQPGFGFNVYKVDQATLDRFLNGPSPKETARNDMTFLRLSLR